MYSSLFILSFSASKSSLLLSINSLTVVPTGCSPETLLVADVLNADGSLDREPLVVQRAQTSKSSDIEWLMWIMKEIDGINKYDIFSTLAPKNEWDICAGDCIVREAGGFVKTINDKNIIYNQKKTLVTDPIIATNSILFNSVSDLLY